MEWRDIAGCEGYEVSSRGQVRSKTREVLWSRRGKPEIRKYEGRILTQYQTTSGYMAAVLSVKGVRINCLVHRLVADAFIPKVEGKPHVNHKNGIKSDNNDSNLEWATPSENQYHRSRVLLKGRGEKHHKAVLTDEDVRKIRARFAAGERVPEIALSYSVSRTHLHRVIKGECRA